MFYLLKKCLSLKNKISKINESKKNKNKKDIKNKNLIFLFLLRNPKMASKKIVFFKKNNISTTLDPSPFFSKNHVFKKGNVFATLNKKFSKNKIKVFSLKPFTQKKKKKCFFFPKCSNFFFLRISVAVAVVFKAHFLESLNTP